MDVEDAAFFSPGTPITAKSATTPTQRRDERHEPPEIREENRRVELVEGTNPHHLSGLLVHFKGPRDSRGPVPTMAAVSPEDRERATRD
jgi:hypothetical protein